MPILKLKPEMMLGNTPEVKNTKVGDGVQGNLDTLDIMIRKARESSRLPKVRELALRIILANNLKSQHYKDEALAIGQYVKDNLRYVRDIDKVETLIDPLTIIDQLQRNEAFGDCDDMSMFIASLLLSIGHQPYFRIVKYVNDPMRSYSHVYVVDYERNQGEKSKQRIVLDAIIKTKPIGYEIPHAVGKEVKI
jgi:hypothetical protein